MKVDPRKQEFAKRLNAAMNTAGIGASELTRRVKAILPGESKFQHSNISQYIRGMRIPRERYLNAICSALEMSPEDIVPPDEMNSSLRRIPVWTRPTRST